MVGLENYLAPYIISQIVSIILLIVAWKNTRAARVLFALLFFWASGINMYNGIQNPDIYLDFRELAIPLYRDFIDGWFSRNHHIAIPVIALGQFYIAIGMLLKGRWVKLACVGAIIFLMAIAPFKVGSAFPFSLTVSIAAFLIYRNDYHNYLWKRP